MEGSLLSVLGGHGADVKVGKEICTVHKRFKRVFLQLAQRRYVVKLKNALRNVRWQLKTMVIYVLTLTSGKVV